MMFHVKKVVKKVAKMQHYIYLCIVLGKKRVLHTIMFD